MFAVTEEPELSSRKAAMEITDELRVFIRLFMSGMWYEHVVPEPPLRPYPPRRQFAEVWLVFPGIGYPAVCPFHVPWLRSRRTAAEVLPVHDPSAGNW